MTGYLEEARVLKRWELDRKQQCIGDRIAWMPEGLDTLDMDEDRSLQKDGQAQADFYLQRQHCNSYKPTLSEREMLKKRQQERLFFLRKGTLRPVPLWSVHGGDTAHIRLYPSPSKGGIHPGGPVSDCSIRQAFFFCEGNPFLLVHGSALSFSNLRCASFSDLCSQEDSVLHLLDFIDRHMGLCYLSFSFAPSQWTLYQFFKFFRQLLNILSWFPATKKTIFVRLPDVWVQDEETAFLSLLLHGKLPHFVTLEFLFTSAYNRMQKKAMRAFLENFLGPPVRRP